jgi:ribose transport system permease protein
MSNVSVSKSLQTSPPRRRGLTDTSLTTISLVVSFAVLCLFFASQTPFFLTQSNLNTILSTLAIVGISAIGMTLALITGGVDISVGSVAALAGVLTSLFAYTYGLPLGVSAVLAVLAGGLIGAFNGFIITVIKINPLITTLATFSIVRGLAFVFSGGQTNQLSDAAFNFLGRGSIGGVSFSLLIMLALFLLFWYVLRYTQFGRNLYAIGGSPQASRLAGIAVSRHLLIVYTVSGLLAAFSGIINVSQLASSAPRAAVGLEFTVITAVVLGGTSLAGGKGTLLGTLIGVIILRVLDNGLVLMQVSSFYQEVARGVVLILAVGFDQLRLKLAQWRKGRGA